MIVSKVSLGIGLYGAISTALFSFLDEESFTVSFFISILLAILTGVLLYINISLSEKFENEEHSYCGYFWTITFVLGVTMGILTCWVIQAIYWHMCLAFTLWAALYAFSHTTSHEINLTKDLLINAEVKEPEIYAEWLKLEHGCAQTTFQVLISMIGLIVTGGVVGYFLYQGSFWSPGMQDTVIIAVWGLIGVWFGILGPLQYKMYLLRNKVRSLSSAS